MILGAGAPPCVGHEDVGRLEVAVDDALLVRVLHRVTHHGEQPHALVHGEPCLVAELVDGASRHVLHGKVEAPILGGPGLEHARNVGVVHERQRLPLRLEARGRASRVDAHLDHLERHAAADGMRLLGEVDDAHAALSQDVDHVVALVAVGEGAVRIADRCGRGLRRARGVVARGPAVGGVVRDERHHFLVERPVTAAGLEDDTPAVARGDVQRGVKDLLHPPEAPAIHGRSLRGPPRWRAAATRGRTPSRASPWPARHPASPRSLPR